MKIALKTAFDTRDVDVVRAGLVAANREASGRDAGYAPFVFHVLDDRGHPVGGAVGHGSFDWVFVELLFVPETLRGQGWGTRLLAQVEDFATQHGFAGVWLDTFSFQARPFYEKLGYTVFGTLEDHPLGGSRHFLSKRLPAASPQP
ncbi:MAG TPA: GNAT family N-acetyltransferase [Devosia sp.]|jgi:GNAT superfamily N-acetyltransferase|nr:GNAT family N-acetyltransferase [Devosia sp.]